MSDKIQIESDDYASGRRDALEEIIKELRIKRGPDVFHWDEWNRASSGAIGECIEVIETMLTAMANPKQTS